MNNKKKPYYMISAVSRTYNIHPQTLRLYEKLGLLTPSRTEGNTRYYTDDNLDQLEVILNLTRNLGVNLAGVEVILNMRENVKKMQDEARSLIKFVRDSFNVDLGNFDTLEKNALVKVPQSKIVKIKDTSSEEDES
jgi:MerR family transcriptional regulator/heat shock protein HspR